MKGLTLMRLIDAHIRIIRAQAHVHHMPEQMTFGILWSGIAQISAEAVKNRSIHLPRPRIDRQRTDQCKTRTMNETFMQRA